MRCYEVSWYDEDDGPAARFLGTIQEAKAEARKVALEHVHGKIQMRNQYDDDNPTEFCDEFSVHIGQHDIGNDKAARLWMLNAIASGGVKVDAKIGKYIAQRCGTCEGCRSVLDDSWMDGPNPYKIPPQCARPKLRLQWEDPR